MILVRLLRLLHGNLSLLLRLLALGSKILKLLHPLGVFVWILRL